MADLAILPLAEKISYEASKWLKIQVLLDTREVQELFTKLSRAQIFRLSGVAEKPSGEISTHEFLTVYDKYIDQLKNGEDVRRLVPHLATAWTYFSGALYALKSGSGYLIRIQKPAVQVQLFDIDFNVDDKAFRTNLFGPETLSWGLQFSFPHLYMDPVTKDICKVQDPVLFPNVELFKSLQKWMREYSVPAPFLFEGKKVMAPFRIGPKALPWASELPQLAKKNLTLIP